MEELVRELKQQIIKTLNLEDVSCEDIDNDAPLFGDGLGLDSIDALDSMASSWATLRRGRPSSSPSILWHDM